MKELTILNINNCYSYDNVYIELKQYWKNYVIVDKSYNVILTVAIRRSNNTSSILIKNFPVKVTDYEKFFKLLNNRLSLLSPCTLYSITFSFSYTIKVKDLYRFIVFSYLLLTFFIYFLLFIYIRYDNIEIIGDTSFINTISSINTSISSYDSNIICMKDRFSIFNPIIDLFGKSNTSIKYFPSYFIPTQLGVYNMDVDLLVDNSNLSINNNYVLEITRQEEYNKLEAYSNNLTNLVNDLQDIVLRHRILDIVIGNHSL